MSIDLIDSFQLSINVLGVIFILQFQHHYYNLLVLEYVGSIIVVNEFSDPKLIF